MAFTAEQLATLEAAYTRGILTVSLAGESVTYQSMEDLLIAIANMRRELSPTTTQSYRLAATSKGL